MDLSGAVILLAACAVVIAGAWFVSEIFWWLLNGEGSDDE